MKWLFPCFTWICDDLNWRSTGVFHFENVFVYCVNLDPFLAQLVGKCSCLPGCSLLSVQSIDQMPCRQHKNTVSMRWSVERQKMQVFRKNTIRRAGAFCNSLGRNKKCINMPKSAHVFAKTDVSFPQCAPNATLWNRDNGEVTAWFFWNDCNEKQVSTCIQGLNIVQVNWSSFLCASFPHNFFLNWICQLRLENVKLSQLLYSH